MKLKAGDAIYTRGQRGVVTGFAKDDRTVPWVKLDNGMDWDARDLGYIQLRCTKKKPVKLTGAFHEESERLIAAQKGGKREVRRCKNCGIEFEKAVFV
jgi:hypothetical protein